MSMPLSTATSATSSLSSFPWEGIARLTKAPAAASPVRAPSSKSSSPRSGRIRDETSRLTKSPNRFSLDAGSRPNQEVVIADQVFFYVTVSQAANRGQTVCGAKFRPLSP